MLFPLPPSFLSGDNCLPRMATASLWGCKATAPGSARQEMRTEGARKGGGPGASAGGGTELRGTGCSTGSTQLEEAAAPKMCAKTQGETSGFPTPPRKAEAAHATEGRQGKESSARILLLTPERSWPASADIQQRCGCWGSGTAQPQPLPAVKCQQPSPGGTWQLEQAPSLSEPISDWLGL